MGAGSDYGSALATTAAANSLNSILTNELNKLSGKYITFADLDIGMQRIGLLFSFGRDCDHRHRRIFDNFFGHTSKTEISFLSPGR